MWQRCLLLKAHRIDRASIKANRFEVRSHTARYLRRNARSARGDVVHVLHCVSFYDASQIERGQFPRRATSEFDRPFTANAIERAGSSIGGVAYTGKRIRSTRCVDLDRRSYRSSTFPSITQRSERKQYLHQHAIRIAAGSCVRETVGDSPSLPYSKRVCS